MAASPPRPIRLLVLEDDLERSRLTVVFRMILVIPHLVWLVLWGFAAFVVSFVLWLGVLIEGTAPEILHDFVAGYVRYATHVGAYLYLAAGPYPGFRGRPGYPVDLEIDPPERQSRWTAFFRILLALPFLLLAAVLGGGLSVGSQGGSWGSASGEASDAAWSGVSAAGAAAAAAILAWFATVALGRTPRGLRDLVAYAVGYGAQTAGYLLLLTGRYPSSDPAMAERFSYLPEHPVRTVVAEGLERPRLTVVFRLLLAIPHFVWLLLWSVVVIFAALGAWLAALVTGAVPSGLHRFLAAYVRYVLHLFAFIHLVGRRFPGFTGTPGSYGIDLEIDPPARQNRWKTAFRVLLAIPAVFLGGALGGVLLVLALLAWFYAVVTGRMPEGLRNLGVACLRYGAQLDAYLLLLTDRYPYAAPVLRSRAAERFHAPGPPTMWTDSFVS